MANVNLVFLLGHLGHDLEHRSTANGTPVVNFRMATTQRWKDEAGEKQERTEWHRVVSFGPTAEFLKEYATKGSMLHVEGSLQTREWTDREGVKRYTTEVLSWRVQLLGNTNREPANPPPTEEPPADADSEPPESDIPF